MIYTVTYFLEILSVLTQNNMNTWIDSALELGEKTRTRAGLNML